MKSSGMIMMTMMVWKRFTVVEQVTARVGMNGSGGVTVIVEKVY